MGHDGPLPRTAQRFGDGLLGAGAGSHADDLDPYGLTDLLTAFVNTLSQKGIRLQGLSSVGCPAALEVVGDHPNVSGAGIFMSVKELLAYVCCQVLYSRHGLSHALLDYLAENLKIPREVGALLHGRKVHEDIYGAGERAAVPVLPSVPLDKYGLLHSGNAYFGELESVIGLSALHVTDRNHVEDVR